MTDTPPTDSYARAAERAAEYEFELARLRIQASSAYVGRMIWIITLIAGLISVIVVLSVVGLTILGAFIGERVHVPEVLSNWGGIILGFYFGQFVNIVKDFMGLVAGAPLSAPPKASTKT